MVLQWLQHRWAAVSTTVAHLFGFRPTNNEQKGPQRGKEEYRSTGPSHRKSPKGKPDRSISVDAPQFVPEQQPPMQPPLPEEIQQPMQPPLPEEMQQPMQPPLPEEIQQPMQPPLPEEIQQPMQPPLPEEFRQPMQPPLPEEIQQPMQPPLPEEFKVDKLPLTVSSLNSTLKLQAAVVKGPLTTAHGKGLRYPGKQWTMLLVGASGSGKTIMLNAIANYVYGIDWKSCKRLQISQDASTEDDSTEYLTAYKLEDDTQQEIQSSLTVVDTPGAGYDAERDELLQKQLIEFLSDGQNVDVLCYVVKASVSRLTAEQKAIFHLIQSALKNSEAKKRYALATHCDAGIVHAFKAMEEAGIICDRHFRFNNACLYADNRDEENQLFMSTCWAVNKDSFDALFADLCENS